MSRILLRLTSLAGVMVLRLTPGFAQSPPVVVEPALRIRIFNAAKIPSAILDAAAVEGAAILRGFNDRLIWLNCDRPENGSACGTLPVPADLDVRVVARALPEACGSALGMTFWSESGGLATVFSDRVSALYCVASIHRTGFLLPTILGRVMAHEVVHLLMGSTPHAGEGLMKGHWVMEDLRIGRGGALGLTAVAIKQIEQEMRRRSVSESMADCSKGLPEAGLLFTRR